MMGRPTNYTPEIADEICDRLMKGESLKAICKDADSDWMPNERTVYRWLEAHEDFRQQYTHAREVQADTLFDEIVLIADGADFDPNATPEEKAAALIRDPQRDRLRVDARKWVASKLAPKKYGDKLIQEHTGPDGAPLMTDAMAALAKDKRDALREALRVAMAGDA